MCFGRFALSLRTDVCVCASKVYFHTGFLVCNPSTGQWRRTIVKGVFLLDLDSALHMQDHGMPASVKGVFPYRLAPVPPGLRCLDVCTDMGIPRTSTSSVSPPNHASVIHISVDTIHSNAVLPSAQCSACRWGKRILKGNVRTAFQHKKELSITLFHSHSKEGWSRNKLVTLARKYNRVSECATEHVELLAQIKMENTVYILSSTELLCVTHCGTKHVCSFESCVHVANSIPQGHEREAQKEAKYSSKFSHLKIMIKKFKPI